MNRDYYLASDLLSKRIMLSDGFITDWPICYPHNGQVAFDNSYHWPLRWLRLAKRALTA